MLQPSSTVRPRRRPAWPFCPLALVEAAVIVAFGADRDRIDATTRGRALNRRVEVVRPYRAYERRGNCGAVAPTAAPVAASRGARSGLKLSHD